MENKNFQLILGKKRAEITKFSSRILFDMLLTYLFSLQDATRLICGQTENAVNESLCKRI
ncbi:hypothetical protein QR98_0061330 [Sarcoptes scabiei]|uniref:Uncharacterized protein n=1 Tax=Sarcoptes scabiei TaxID=52283 RepID=A0A132A9I1_SARSC|nr:hypothetical protein QR98_0061330 [Sarcoptes scabiei]